VEGSPGTAASAADQDDVRLRILLPVLARAEELLEGRGHASLSPGIGTHPLRNTFASLLFAIGAAPLPRRRTGRLRAGELAPG
jgi:hypothetical protein